MTNSQVSPKSVGIISWLQEVSKTVNADNKLAPNKAIQKRIENMIEVHGAEKIWEGVEQISMTFDMTNPSIVEALYENYPELPGLIKKEAVFKEAFNRWCEQNSGLITKFRETSTAILRANPVIEWQVDSSPEMDANIEPIMDFLFRKKEGS
ncbi:MAG: hypothetical protein WC369_03600 [Dehalococcoidales bacterium]|jgi:hypothetical protein